MSNIERRLERIERQSRKRCDECGSAPVRILGTDPVSGDVLTSNLLADECPACGRGTYVTVHIVGVDAGRL